METSEKCAELFKGLVKARQNIKQPDKAVDNPFFHSKYVSLEGVAQAVDEACKDTGISYLQEATTFLQNQFMGVSVVTVIFHESGQWLKLEPLIVPAGKKTAQGMGSAETYARRYSLSAAFGVTSDIDDDGNEASDNYSQGQQYQQGRQYQQQAEQQPVTNTPEIDKLLTVYRKMGAKITNEAAKTYYDRAARKVGITTNGQTPTNEQAVSMAKQLNVDLMEIEDKERKESQQV